MSPLVLDLALSRRIELSEARAGVGAATALGTLRPDIGVAIAQIGSGFAVYCGANSPVTQAVGIGLNGAVSTGEFAGLERFFASRNEPVRVETSPLVDSSLIELFGKRGYRVTEFTNVMAMPAALTDLSNATKQRPPNDASGEITVERVSREDVGLWNRTVSQGFAEHTTVTPELGDLMSGFALAPNVECYLARVNGEAAGAGTLVIRDGVAGLFGSSTLPAFRRRGVQTALLQRRTARAVEAGCDLIVCLAQPGSSSQRNVLRRGFEVLYTRVKFERVLEQTKT